MKTKYNDSDEQPQENLELAKKIITSKYDCSGEQEQIEFRTTMELQYELSEMITLSETSLQDIMIDLGFKIKFIEDKPNWVLYRNDDLFL